MKSKFRKSPRRYFDFSRRRLEVFAALRCRGGSYLRGLFHRPLMQQKTHPSAPSCLCKRGGAGGWTGVLPGVHDRTVHLQ